MPALRRAVAPAPVAEGVNFGALDFYVRGGGMPEGDYQLTFLVMMFQAQNQQGVSKGPARLGVQIQAQPLGPDLEPTADPPREQFYSMGSKADQSFAPDPETGKGLVPIPGGPALNMNDSTNWAILLKSLYDTGLPPRLFTNDLTVIDGIKVHMANIPEPEERSKFQSKTGEAAEDRKPGTIAIVTEIKEEGRPWEEAAPAPAVRKPVAAAPKPGAPRAPVAPVAPKPAAPRPAPRAAAPVAAAAAEEVSPEDIEQAALSGAEVVLTANPAGISKLGMRTGLFKAVSASHGEDMASAVTEAYCSTDANLILLVGQHGYTLNAQGKVVPA